MATYDPATVRIDINGKPWTLPSLIRSPREIEDLLRGQLLDAEARGLIPPSAPALRGSVRIIEPSTASSISRGDPIRGASGQIIGFAINDVAPDGFVSVIVPRLDFVSGVVRLVDTTTQTSESLLRLAWQRRLCASIDAAARKTPITAAELRARLFARPLPRRRLRDGRLGPQAYAPEDPLPLP